MEEINLQEIQSKLYEKVKVSGWGPAMVNQVMSQDFLKILQTLLRESQDGKKFTPQIKNLFRAFEECPYDKLQVVIIGQDPYPNVNVADGIAFSCSNLGVVEKSLEYIFKSIEDTVNPDYVRDPDLRRWAHQGVLLLNSGLTTTLNKPGSHQMLWKQFMTELIDYLVWNKQDIAYVFLGKKAAEFAEMVPDNQLKIIVSHPASAAYMTAARWECNDLWNKINNYLKSNEREPITW
ncbi:uracil-DNA glycosylase [bacterium]|nr:uracil-DNA glycosylase [bacterium]NDD82681.1 uracil-DNA glycosylase [bacterium]NDG30519.1 uracil-DNA glycosylase [bacterium]